MLSESTFSISEPVLSRTKDKESILQKDDELLMEQSVRRPLQEVN